MAVQIIMNRSGDTRYEFSETDTAAIAIAEERFRQLTAKGFRAVALGLDGSPGKLMQTFDVKVEQTLFIPQLQGG